MTLKHPWQNERFEDWTPTILELKNHFTTYKEDILNHHHLNDADASQGRVPKARISCASRGNFLEVLNMTLNTFENHYLNRNLERTGQQCTVITPGTSPS